MFGMGGRGDAAEIRDSGSRPGYTEIQPKESRTPQERQDIRSRILNRDVIAEIQGPLQDKRGGLEKEKEVREPIQNKQDGLERERAVREELEQKYPSEKGNQIVSEAYLRGKNGNIIKDSVTGEARRVDFAVVKDGKAVASIEVTSKTADKREQTAKEERIRDAGGNYIRDNRGELVEIPSNVRTQIERRD